MAANCGRVNGRRRGEGGSIMVMTAILMVGLFLALGLAIDVSRVYAVRADLQNAADAAALAGARELNSGSGGINDAVTRASAIANSYGPERSPITVAAVEFAVNRDGPYVDQAAAAGAPANIRFVRVTTQAVNVPILFAVRALGDSDAETGQAVAGQSVGINGICDFFPIAVALTNPNPAPNTTMLLNFVQGTGSSATLSDRDYIILEVPDITGNGAPETAVLSAGLTNICASLNSTIEFKMTPSANLNNGPRQIEDGVNTRFNIYAGGYGNALQPSTFPPDSNVQQNITFDQYSDGDGAQPQRAGPRRPPHPDRPHRRAGHVLAPEDRDHPVGGLLPEAAHRQRQPVLDLRQLRRPRSRVDRRDPRHRPRHLRPHGGGDQSDDPGPLQVSLWRRPRPQE